VQPLNAFPAGSADLSYGHVGYALWALGLVGGFLVTVGPRYVDGLGELLPYVAGLWVLIAVFSVWLAEDAGESGVPTWLKVDLWARSVLYTLLVMGLVGGVLVSVGSRYVDGLGELLPYVAGLWVVVVLFAVWYTGRIGDSA